MAATFSGENHEHSSSRLTGGVAIHKSTDIDRAVEAWLKHPCLHVGDVLEIRPVDEGFNARIAAPDALAERR
jgi:hypothetical protein